MFKLKGLGLTPATAVERLAANDPSLTVCDLRNNAVLQMKASELVPKLAAALAGNNTCQELNLGACGINDECATSLASALSQNKTLIHLNLEENRIGNDGATAVAKALAQNRTLMQLNMLNQKGTRFGDATLHAFTDMFATNVTLLKIIWRLESRQSFRLTKMLTRNNECALPARLPPPFPRLRATACLPHVSRRHAWRHAWRHARRHAWRHAWRHADSAARRRPLPIAHSPPTHDQRCARVCPRAPYDAPALTEGSKLARTTPTYCPRGRSRCPPH